MISPTATLAQITVAEIKGSENPVEARRERGSNEYMHAGLIYAAQMKDERAARFHLFQSPR